MPLYAYKCDCGKTEDAFRKIEDRERAPECCGKSMSRVIGNYSVIPDMEPHVEYNMTEKPVWVKSRKHHERLCREHGVTPKFGKGWM